MAAIGSDTTSFLWPSFPRCHGFRARGLFAGLLTRCIHHGSPQIQISRSNLPATASISHRRRTQNLQLPSRLCCCSFINCNRRSLCQLSSRYEPQLSLRVCGLQTTSTIATAPLGQLRHRRGECGCGGHCELGPAPSLVPWASLPWAVRSLQKSSKGFWTWLLPTLRAAVEEPRKVYSAQHF